MFSYIKKFVSFLPGVRNAPEEEESDEDQIIKTIRTMNLNPDESSDSDSDSVDLPPLGKSGRVAIPVKTFKCVQKSGRVTYLSEEYGLIDETIYFVRSQVSPGVILKKNEEVLYTAYKIKDNETERVYKINSLKNDSWENDTSSPETNVKLINTETEELKGITRHITGRVTKRKGRDMYIDTINTWCNLDKIETTFIPIEGDWVSMTAVVAVDTDAPNFAGDLIEIISMKPLLKKSSCGRVTLWSVIKKEGIIENSVFFTAVNCENGYSPKLGDQVVYDAIESDQDSLKWRALVVYYQDKNLSEEHGKISNVKKNIVKPVEVSDSTDDNGISVSPPVCGVQVELDGNKTICFKITNNSSLPKCIKSVSIIAIKNSQLSFTTTPKKNHTLLPNKSVEVHLACKGRFLGLSGETCLFRFEGFAIARKIEISVLSSKEMDELLNCKSGEVFKRKKASRNNQKPDIVLFGPKVWQAPKFISRERKCVFTLPKRLQDIFNKNLKKAQKLAAVEAYAPYLKFDLDFAHYADRFHTFLYLEELELRMHLRNYDMDGVILSRCGDYLSLKVPGIVERRPSVVMGDSIILSQPWSEKNKIEYVGFIHHINEKEIFIKFHSSFHDLYDGSECNIKFLPNLFFFCRCHEAVNRAQHLLGEKWLFPSSVNEKPPQINISFADVTENDSKVQEKLSELPELNKTNVPVLENLVVTKKNKTEPFVWVNNSLNQRQKLAVINVLKNQGRPLPYIIFGPPGTGKTVTLVEIILQVYFLIPESRILVTTPSNSAADLICTRLIQMVDIQPGELVRLTAITRILEGLVPAQLKAYTTFYHSSECNRNDFKNNENIRSCSVNELTGKHKITVSTCTNVGRLHFSGFPAGHFTHILIDEAGQTIEPEVLISATFQNIENGMVVLAGDPQQLGPVICSSIAKYYGFDESLLERFTKTFPYARDLKSFPDTSGFDPRFIMKLNVNYRSVPEILTLPNQMFYNSELIPALSQTEGEEAEIIKKFNFMDNGRDKPAALIFHGIIGTNYQEVDSPSWFNPHEIWQVIIYLRKLYSIGLKCSDVGILTPYAKQASKIAKLLNSLNLAAPKIGTVEEFQGQERKVIILSTVRSCLKLLGTDIYYHLGFVASPKRLNVLLTRARALLIIVGNPVLLSEDPYWVTVINYCIQNKSYTGCNLKYFSYNLQLCLKKEEIEAEDEEEEENQHESEKEEEVKAEV